MATQILDNTTLEEKLIWYAIVLTYPFYVIGALYVTGAIVGWVILAVALLRFFVEGRDEEARVPVLVWLWILGMLVMEVALIVAHINWDLGLAKTIKSSIGWAKGWALLALFPLLGAILKVRLEIVVRAIAVVAAQGLLFSVVTVMAYLVGLPGEIFVSPLKAVGGPGDEFFTFSMYGINPETGAGRWQFFCPWAPAAGLIACLYLVFCLLEQNSFWRYSGMAGCLAMVLLCQSRAGLAIFPVIVVLMAMGNRLLRPWTLITLGIVIPVLLVFGEPIYEAIMNSFQAIKEARPDSTRVRSTLARLAVQRWQAEAPFFGHGIVERGPKIVELMPIGSHHSWYGLLFVKGLVGLLALAIPMVCSLLYLLLEAQRSRVAVAALTLLAVIIGYSFFENLEILSYLYWPALFWMGVAFNPLKNGTKL